MLPTRDCCIIALLFSALTVISVTQAGVVKSTAKATDPDWWKHAVFYQIYPKSFKDSDGNGKGDLKGIISKLEHLKDMGVTAAWLSPIYKSPQADQGYDISDYRDIDPLYGNMDDFKELVKKVHELGMKIVMDFVPNHSSNEHEWFKKALAGDEKYRNYYIWRPKNEASPPNNWISVFGGSAWECCEDNTCYFHNFLKEQPDLNFAYPDVVQEMKDILKFWMDNGVDGFRMDAVQNLMEDDCFRDEPESGIPGVAAGTYKYLNHIYTLDQPGTYNLIYEWREFMEKYSNEKGGDPRIMMTEAYTNIKNTMLYYGDENRDGAHFTFNFFLITDLKKDFTTRQLVDIIKKWLTYIPLKYTSNWVLGNHDNHRVATRFGPERVDNFNILAALLPGIMVTYNGEEIGQENGEVTLEQCKDNSACNEENFVESSRDFERTPFHWDDSKNAGFSDADQTWLPVSSKYRTNNLKAQNGNGIKSHYNDYKALLKLRQEPAFTNGSFNIFALSDNVLAIKREAVNGDSYAVIINNGNQKEVVDLSPLKVSQKFMKIVLTDVNSAKINRIVSTKQLTLAPYESLVGKVIADVPLGSSDWWKHAVFYQIYPRSFKDNDNNGIGDLKGIISKLDHLKDAGITAAWLSPIYKSPQVDQGYDISDFREIDADYGSMEDFDKLIEEAHKRKIKIIMDFVPNHSSDKHEWFIKSENSEIGYKDFYVWRDGKNGGPPNNWISQFKFSAWKYSNTRNQYYLHQFAEAQPDLNYKNPNLVEEMMEVLDYWLDKGVDGFRMDAVPYLFEDAEFRDEPLSGTPGATANDYNYLKHIYTSDLPGTFDMIYKWRERVDNYSTLHGGDARVMMTESYTDINNTMYYYGDGKRLGAHFTFNFQLITKLRLSHSAKDVVDAIKEWLEYMPKNAVANWVLGNHDNHRVASRFGPENADGFNMLTALLPGVMVTYNGEEIGQENGEVTWVEGKDPSACNGEEEDFDKVSRDFERTPFHWDDTTNAGFNEGAEPWLPVSEKYITNNLAQQREADNSHYKIYKELLELRKNEVLVNGGLDITTLGSSVIAYVRSLNEFEAYLFIFNVGNDVQEVSPNNSVFPDATPLFEVVLTSAKSNHKKGDLMSADKLSLQPHEAIIAKTSAVNPDPSPSPSPDPSPSPSPDPSPSPNPSNPNEGVTILPTFTIIVFIITICNVIF